MLEQWILELEQGVVVPHRRKHIERNQQDVDHHAREGKNLNEERHSHSFVRVCIVLQEGVVPQTYALKKKERRSGYSNVGAAELTDTLPI